jgi:hypothetical protein
MRRKKWNKPIEGEWASTLIGYIKDSEEKVSLPVFSSIPDAK